MHTRSAIAIAAAALLAVTLTACSTTTASTPTPSASTSSSNATSAQAKTKIQANAKAAPSDQYTAVPNAQSVFLNAMHDQGLFGLDSMSDADLVAAGKYTCDQIAAGTPYGNIIAIQGDTAAEPHPGYNNENLKGMATETFCTQFIALRDQYRMSLQPTAGH